MMLVLLTIIIAVIAAVLCLPAGVQVRCADNDCRLRLILCGLRFPLPQKYQAQKQELPRSRTSFLRQFWPKQHFAVCASDIKLVFRIVRNLLKCVRFRMKQLDIAIATPDPAATGILYGLAYAGISALPRRIPVTFCPDFYRTSPLINGTASVTVIPLRILTVSLPLLHLLWRVRRRSDIRANS
jgi:hypothetical protein